MLIWGRQGADLTQRLRKILYDVGCAQRLLWNAGVGMVRLLARKGSKWGVVTPLTRRLVEISRPGGCRVMSKAHAQRRQRLVRRAGLRTPGSGRVAPEHVGG